MQRDILILRDPKESWKRCSLAPLRGVDGVRFVTFRQGLEVDVGDRILLDPSAPELDPADRGRPLFLIDSSWRRLPLLRSAIVGDPTARSLPRVRTAYPRRSRTFEDPESGLASIEALFTPSAASRWSGAASRSAASTSRPLLRARLRHIGSPMVPTPINPILSAIRSSVSLS